MPKHVVDICREADLPELFTLFADWYRFNPRLREKEFFDWQFRDGPVRLSGGEYDFLLLRDPAGRIVGCLGTVGFEFRRDGKVDRGGWTHNWRAESRGEGGLALLARFMELVDNRFLLRLNESSTRIVHLLRVPILSAMPRWWAALDGERASRLLGLDASDRRVAKMSVALFERRRSSPRVQRVFRLDADWEFTFPDWPSVRGYVRRTGRYLNWRYFDIPKHDYRMIATERAFAVYRVEPVMGTDTSVLRLVEWTFGSDEGPGALSAIAEDTASERPVLVDFHCTHRPVGALLEQFGFVGQGTTQAAIPDLFRPMNHSGGYAVAIDLPPHRTDRSIDFDSWYTTIGDSDIDRVKL